jgi:hypothetical protein
MNDRIQKLAEQANLQLIIDDGDFDLRKFADKLGELIIRECANYINERTLDWDADLRWIFNDGSGDMAVDVDDLLNRHFGVEE